LANYLAPIFEKSVAIVPVVEMKGSTEIILMCVSVGSAVLAFLYAFIKYS
jgi:hypothetical protein